MEAVVLAAGYATRLRPLTNRVAKPLLPLAGRPMIDYLADKIDEVGDVEAIHVVTNSRFAADFEAWASSRSGRVPVRVHDDGTTSNNDRLGAIGDLRFVIERAGLEDEDLLVVAGDNLFDFSLEEYVAFWRSRGGSAIGVHDVGDLDLARRYGIVELDDSDRVVSLAEKPERPAGTLASIAAYLFPAEHAALVRKYLEEGNAPDQPGRFVVWLYPRVPVHGYRFQGDWLDIGDREQLLEADNRMRRRAGLSEQAEYSLQPSPT
ncbi:MAG TPA: nucleotidyltransferase family protein [Gaiellaceae bacterium]|nr:nucleotidyltransferase family protein [Gaiellaceae bacterium]